MEREKDDAIVIAASGLDGLIDALRVEGFAVWGARERDGALSLGPIDGAADLPRGRIDLAEPGRVRIVDGARDAYFDHVLPAQTLKPLLTPPQEVLFAADPDLTVHETPVDAPPLAVIGVRPCDLAALLTLTAVFEDGPFVDTRYRRRRESLFLVSVNCMRAAATCFCASMNTGPRAESGFDLSLDELIDADRHVFVVTAGSARGRRVLKAMEGTAATPRDREAARDGSQACAETQVRHMVDGVEDLLKRNYEHPNWQSVAERCLACANCTMVCPTCFCTNVEDQTALDGGGAERRRRWDSCFGLDYSYLHGGSVRTETSSRYRQWITHKLAHWHDQFGMSGCVGCGRCIAWCPVGIDITEEVVTLSASEAADGR